MMEQPTLTCTACIEEFSKQGDTLRKVVHKNLTLTLGRNEFCDVIIKLDFGKKEVKYTVRDVLLHKKFARDGKATIKLLDHNLQLMLSNCPPDRLIVFLKTLNIKLECLKKKGFVSSRKKMMSEKPRSFEEISPLTVRDFQIIRDTKLKTNKTNDMVTPRGKRKRDNSDDKENLPLEKLRVPRKLIASPSSIIVNPVKLNKAQSAVLEAIKRGRNVFFTGSAGTGKSFLLRRIIGALPPNHTFATASTGVAACHIGGTTLHGFAGIGSGRGTLETCIELASRSQVAQQWKKCNHLIIDEISMVDGELFDKLENIARVVRKNDSPFGGIQLIVCGDFLQLPPVQKGQEKKLFCFQSRGWQKCIDVNMELGEVRRQSDKHFIDILQNIRMGRCPDHMAAVLRKTASHNIEKDGIIATRLCTHKEDVDQMNNFHLQKLDGKSHRFYASDSDEVYTSQIDKLCPVSHDLELKVGTQVMLAKNLDVQRGLVNGARGVVTSFENGNLGYPLVKFACGVTEVIKMVRWTMKAGGGVYLSRKQIPLKLAWAISVHKSQGMTLDCVEISLSRVFESGQAYVALSRAKSLEGLRVLDFDKNCVRAHPDVLRFYHQLKLSQRMLQTNMEDFSGITRLHW